MSAELETKESGKVSDYTGGTDASGKVYDMYANILNYKKEITALNRPAVSVSWIPTEHRRRLKAYEILSSYEGNYSRDYRLNPETDGTNMNDEIMEAGDAHWLSNKIKDKLLGSAVSINIPVPKSAGSDRLFERMLKRDYLTPEEKKILEERKKEAIIMGDIVADRELYLQGWWFDNMIFNTINKNEAKCGYLGDCVYQVGWDKEKKIPILSTYDPGFCFPFDYTDNPDTSMEDGQTAVEQRFVLAWEEFPDNQEFFKVYREVYELRLGAGGTKRCFVHKALYRYAGSGSEITVLDFKDDDIQGENKGWEDLGIGFIPFKWVPNVLLEGEEPFGRSTIQMSIDNLDNLMNNYTDMNINSEYLGGAIVAFSGSKATPRRETDGSYKPMPIQPRSAYFLGEHGKADLIDTSNMQNALIETRKIQMETFLRNNDVPEIIAGKLGGSTVIPSGVALTIMLQPLIDKLNPMRQQRIQDYAELFNMIQTLYATFGDAYEKKLFSGRLFPVKMQFGALVPQDADAKDKHFDSLGERLSEETILEKMKDAGEDIDIEQEKERLKAEKAANVVEQQELFANRRGVDEIN